MSPTINSDGVPESCLSLTVRSTWAHFKRVGRSVTKQTYRIPPRTTVAGMLAAIVGSDRDSYYEVFAADVSAIAITSLSDIRTLNIPTTGLGTDPKQSVTGTAGGSRQKYSLTYQRTEGDRQLHSYEVLADPAYRIDVALEDEEYYRTLRDRLDSEEFYYVPSLGKSEYLCTVENIDVNPELSAVEESDKYDIDSVVPLSLSAAEPQPGVTYGIERSPAIMEWDSGGRRTTRFDDYVYTRKADATVRVPSTAEITPVKIDGRTVVFR